MIFKDTLAKPFDPTYLDLVGNLVRTLVDRVIHFYQGTPRDEILFREELQELQDNLLYYEQFKVDPVSYSPQSSGTAASSNPSLPTSKSTPTDSTSPRT